jgi:hypothetical protein
MPPRWQPPVGRSRANAWRVAAYSNDSNRATVGNLVDEQARQGVLQGRLQAVRRDRQGRGLPPRPPWQDVADLTSDDEPDTAAQATAGTEQSTHRRPYFGNRPVAVQPLTSIPIPDVDDDEEDNRPRDRQGRLVSNQDQQARDLSRIQHRAAVEHRLAAPVQRSPFGRYTLPTAVPPPANIPIPNVDDDDDDVVYVRPQVVAADGSRRGITQDEEQELARYDQIEEDHANRARAERQRLAEKQKAADLERDEFLRGPTSDGEREAYLNDLAEQDRDTTEAYRTLTVNRDIAEDAAIARQKVHGIYQPHDQYPQREYAPPRSNVLGTGNRPVSFIDMLAHATPEDQQTMIAGAARPSAVAPVFLDPQSNATESRSNARGSRLLQLPRPDPKASGSFTQRLMRRSGKHPASQALYGQKTMGKKTYVPAL